MIFWICFFIWAGYLCYLTFTTGMFWWNSPYLTKMQVAQLYLREWIFFAGLSFALLIFDFFRRK